MTTTSISAKHKPIKQHAPFRKRKTEGGVSVLFRPPSLFLSHLRIVQDRAFAKGRPADRSPKSHSAAGELAWYLMLPMNTVYLLSDWPTPASKAYK